MEMAEHLCSPEYSDLSAQLGAENYFEEQNAYEYQRLSDLNARLIHHELDPARADCFKVYRNEEGRWLASFDYIAPNGVRIPQRLRPVRLEMHGLSEEELATGMRNHFLDVAVAIVQSNEPPMV